MKDWTTSCLSPQSWIPGSTHIPTLEFVLVLFFFSVGAEVEFMNLDVFSGLPVLNISHICRADVGVSEPCSAHIFASCTVSSLHVSPAKFPHSSIFNT